MRWLICGLAALLAMTYFTPLLGADDQNGGATSITGILIDQKCGANMMKKDDPEAAAADHPKSCATADACAASGYAVIKGKTMYKFDEKGNNLAKEWLAKTDKADHLRVVVEGTVKDDQIEVTSLKAAE